MTQVEEKILHKLVELDNAVKSMATATQKPNLLPLFEEIDSLTYQLPKGTHPELLHFLHKKSYEKARLFLQGRQSETSAGTCRHEH